MGEKGRGRGQKEPFFRQLLAKAGKALGYKESLKPGIYKSKDGKRVIVWDERSGHSKTSGKDPQRESQGHQDRPEEAHTPVDRTLFVYPPKSDGVRKALLAQREDRIRQGEAANENRGRELKAGRARNPRALTPQQQRNAGLEEQQRRDIAAAEAANERHRQELEAERAKNPRVLTPQQQRNAGLEEQQRRDIADRDAADRDAADQERQQQQRPVQRDAARRSLDASDEQAIAEKKRREDLAELKRQMDTRQVRPVQRDLERRRAGGEQQRGRDTHEEPHAQDRGQGQDRQTKNDAGSGAQGPAPAKQPADTERGSKAAPPTTSGSPEAQMQRGRSGRGREPRAEAGRTTGREENKNAPGGRRPPSGPQAPGGPGISK